MVYYSVIYSFTRFHITSSKLASVLFLKLLAHCLKVQKKINNSKYNQLVVVLLFLTLKKKNLHKSFHIERFKNKKLFNKNKNIHHKNVWGLIAFHKIFHYKSKKKTIKNFLMA